MTENNKALLFQKEFYSKSNRLNLADLESGAHFLEAKCFLKKINPGYFCEVGCATAPLSRYLKNRGWICCGFDISNAIYTAKKNGINVCECDLATTWPIKANKFDVIFLGEIIEHILDTDFVICESWRILKNNGSLILSTPNLVSLENRIRSVFGYHPRFMDFRLSDNSIGHCRYYTITKLITQLKENGFEILSAKTINASLMTKKREIKLPGFFNKIGLGTNIFVIAKALKNK
ncbi:MAG: hypothetical protein A2Y08_00825 [Planctomycetes bacterium GWA2_40_7]|nr:MAG: hypothetical protein A2Y08_00825 [Planctomycetes bacterium GWA2_40_7]